MRGAAFPFPHSDAICSRSGDHTGLGGELGENLAYCRPRMATEKLKRTSRCPGARGLQGKRLASAGRCRAIPRRTDAEVEGWNWTLFLHVASMLSKMACGTGSPSSRHCHDGQPGEKECDCPRSSQRRSRVKAEGWIQSNRQALIPTTALMLRTLNGGCRSITRCQRPRERRTCSQACVQEVAAGSGSGPACVLRLLLLEAP